MDVSPEPRVESELRGQTGERRYLTVLFSDLVGSTQIAAKLDPEEWREVVASYHRAATDAITRFDGYVANYLGDGVMAYFGWPEAHDNNAERAARAGLAIIDAIARLNEQHIRPKLSARVGIDSGAVVVSAGLGKETDAFGDTPNIASRVQAAAVNDTVLITEATYRLLSGLFVVEDRGLHPLKGIEKPVRLYQVVRPSGVRGRLEAAAVERGLTPFVGRDDELRSLLKRWELVLDGEGQVAQIMGEAGIGKSRLVQRFHEHITGPHTWIEAAAAPFYQNTPFYPISELLQQLVWQQNLDRLDDYLRDLQGRNREYGSDNQFHGEEPGKQLTIVESGLAAAGLNPAEAIPLIAPLIHLRASIKYPASQLTPEQQRRRLLSILVEWLLGAARMHPLVILIEDLHWADPSSLELIQLLVEQGAAAGLLLLLTARPEFRPQWPLRAHHSQMTLNRLSTRDVRLIVSQVAAQKALSDETVTAVVERTSGVPLFAEELTRAVLESGNHKLMGREIPVTLHDSLMSRLDRLGPAKEVIQIGAVIGGEFTYELLHAVHPIADADLQRALRSLTDAELLYVRGIAPDSTYRFKHALIRDAAYEALLKTRRKELHGLVARSIEQKFVTLKDAHPEVLARHWTEAGETEAAIAAWSTAGRSGQARHAFSEALESYEQSLSLLDMLPESPQRDLRELDLRQTVVQMLHVTRGYSASETINATTRAATLAEKSGSLRQFLNVMIARGVNALSAGDLSAAASVTDQVLELALRESSSGSLLGRMHALQMMVHYYRGDLARVEKHFAEGLPFFSDLGFRRVPGSVAAAFGTASCNAWTRGHSDTARARAAQMMSVVDKSRPYDMAFCGFEAAQLHVYLQEYKQAEAAASGALELSEKHQFPWLAAMSRCALGRARAELGLISDGIELIQNALHGLLDIGSRFCISNFMACLAMAQARSGSPADALETTEQALQANPDELVFHPEILCLQGTLHVAQSQLDSAEHDFRSAIKLAHDTGAEAWELRASVSLARVLRDSSRRNEARSTLDEIYSRFTEGFDTADLKEAKALLDELTL